MAENLTPKQYIDSSNMKQILTAVKNEIPTTVAELTDSSSYAKTADIPTTLPANGGNANTVNNHTVKSDVPENAKFTDTIYDDTEIKGSITKLNRDLTENNVTLAASGNTYVTSYSAWNVGKEVFFNFDLKVNDTLNANAWYDIGNLSISPNQNFYYTCIYNNNQIGSMQITKDGLLKLYIGDVIYQRNTPIIASGVYHI